MRYALTSQAGYLDEPWTKKVPDQPALFLVSLFFVQGGKERDPEEEELEGEADPGEGVVPGAVVKVLDAKGSFVEKEALIPEDPAADSGGDEEENEDDEEGKSFSPDGFFEAAGGVFQDGVGFLQIDTVVLVALGIQKFYYGDAEGLGEGLKQIDCGQGEAAFPFGYGFICYVEPIG